MPKPASNQSPTRSFPIDAPEPDGITAALAMLADTEGTVRVYRKRSGLPNAWVATYPASDFDIEAVGRDHGGGDYFAQVCGTDRMKTIQGGGVFSIDGPPKARRVPPPPQSFPGPQTPGAADDPLAALSARVDALVRTIEGGGAPPSSSRDDRPTWRDMIELATRGAAQSQGASLGEMAKFLEIMRPKSNTEELLGTLALIKKLERSPIAAAVDDGGGGLGDLAGLLNGPLAQALAAKLLSDPPAKPPLLAMPRVAAPPQLPTPPVAAPPQSPTPTPADVLPVWLREMVPLVAGEVADRLTAEPDLTAADVADGFHATFPADQLRETLGAVPESAFALSLCRSDQRLAPFVLKIVMAEGALREILATEDDPDEEEAQEATAPIVHTESVAAAPSPEPVAVAVVDPKTNGRKAKSK